MALIITSEIATSGGVTNQAYLNIQKLTYSKGKGADIWVNLYLNEQAREDKPDATVTSNSVYKRFGVSNYGSPGALELLSSETIYEFGYSEIKSILESNGLTVEDSI